jgi:hypothetical protein
VARIVINVEPGKPPLRRKSRRWLRIVAALGLIVALLVVVAAVAGFLWWRHYQSTPVYSLALLIDAAQRGDTEEMAKRLDDEEIARNMISKVSQKAVDRYGGLVRTETQQQIEKTVSSLLPRLTQTIHNEVASEIQNFTVAKSEPFIRLLITMRSHVPITTEGDLAKASAAVSGRIIELTMRRDADRWKVTSFNDDVVVHRVVDGVMKDLPPIGALDSNNPLFKIPRRPRKKRR